MDSVLQDIPFSLVHGWDSASRFRDMDVVVYKYRSACELGV